MDGGPVRYGLVDRRIRIWITCMNIPHVDVMEKVTHDIPIPVARLHLKVFHETTFLSFSDIEQVDSA